MFLRKSNMFATSLIEIISYRAQYQPDQHAYIFLQNGETESGSLTYGELDRQAKAIAAHLQSLQGERALLLYPSGLEFITAFFGCLYAGVIAVPIYPPTKNQKLSRLKSIINNAEPKIVLTTTSILTEIEKIGEYKLELAQLQSIATDKIATNDRDFNFQPVRSENVAFLQYTSGSTGTPKGVMVTHGNIIHNQQLIYQAFGHSEHTIGVSWLPLFHDMGLIGHVIHPIYAGITNILMPPVAFLQKPIRWLQAISKYRATTSGGPNFAYDLCVKKIKSEELTNLDLSSWDLAFNGAEPVRAETLSQFSEKFADCGFNHHAFYPCYGMAETTLFTTGGNKEREPVIQRVLAGELAQNLVFESEITSPASCVFVGCGRPYLDSTVMIVNPDLLTPCDRGQVGEIWVSGGSVAAGYWNQPETTREMFQAHLGTSEEPFLRTGDLGFFQDDELFVTGRLKDLIIIRGRNHYPQDIELTVEHSHPALQENAGAAFSIEIDGSECLVVVCEVKRTELRKLNLDEIVARILVAVSTEHELEVHQIFLLRPGSIPKTSSGKIQRSACKLGILKNTLNVIDEWRRSVKKISPTDVPIDPDNSVKTIAEIENWLTAKIAEILEVSTVEIDRQQPLAIHGLNSLKAVSIATELETWLGIEVAPTIVYEYPSIQALANYLGSTTPILTTSISSLDREDRSGSIAIIGMGCRFPQAANPQEFWSLLKSGGDAIGKVPVSRWKSADGWGGFLEGIDRFDPQFFNISPREASNMDPQQRLLLEVSWEALENAALAASELAGSRSGIFIGISNGDYARLNGNLTNTETYYATGNALSIAANRLSYFLDWHGPSLAMDTACSSSLVAVHQACQSLISGECNLALAGGVNLMLSPQLTLTFTAAQMMAADGRCKTFDAAADGYVRSEGCGVVVLKRLADAIADGDNIQAIIRGSAVNQDGQTNGLTAPNGNSQQEVIRLALAKAGVTADRISYVEAHGTGTALGDPIEVNALKTVLMEGRESDRNCWIGSVKTNIGHLEAAAGIAGLIKTVLSLEHGKIPPHLHLDRLNSYIKLEDTPLEIPTQLQSWSAGKYPRLAGVSAFGFGGTNAHLILEEAPVQSLEKNTSIDGQNLLESQDKILGDRPLHLLTLSAKTDKALRNLVTNYQNHLESSQAESDITSICFSANTGRSHFDCRLAILAADKQELIDRLVKVSDEEDDHGIWFGKLYSNSKLPKIAYLFTGQGSQYVNMGRQLYETQTVFRQTIEQCDRILQPYLEMSLLDILYPDDCQSLDSSIINQTAYTQPALFAIEYALFQLWQSWGIKPDVVMGHSVGEYVAATVAGVFSLEDGLKLITHRGRLMQKLPVGGAMVAVMASAEKVNQLIASFIGAVALAAVNGAESVVISGEVEAISAIIDNLELQGIKTKRLQVSHAFHSPLMEPILAEFELIANRITYNQPLLPLISNLTGSRADNSIATANYWVRHVSQPVKFALGMKTLHQEGCEVFIEVGPKPILLAMGRQCLDEDAGVWLPSLRSGQEDWEILLHSLAELYIRGVKVDWLGFDRQYHRSKLVLPTYPFQRERYWIETSDNDSHKVTNLLLESKKAPFVEWLKDKNTHQLAQKLEQFREFSPEQVKLLPELLETLEKYYQEELALANIKDWFYQVQWKPVRNTQPMTNIQAGHWLIFADKTCIGDILARKLQEQGYEYSFVYRGECYQELEKGFYQLNPTELQDFEKLIQAIEENSQLPLTRVIHLWSLDNPITQDLTITSLWQAQQWGCCTVINLVKALIKTTSLPKMWLVTRGTQSVQSSTEEVSVAASPLWGMGRVISLEHPQLWGGLIDLDTQILESEVDRLLHIILADNHQVEDYLALRGEITYVARLVKQFQAVSQEVSLRSDATYIITGGLGALGLQTAKWMVEKGARHLVLISRTQPSHNKLATISNLEEQGSEIQVFQADVCNSEELSKIFKQVNRDLLPVKGIVHAAGLGRLQPIQQMEIAELEEVIAAKIIGGWGLHQLSKDIQIDFFVSFSSIASVWGSAGLAHYAASNSFLDSLTYYRRAKGLPSFSINWGPLSGGGLARKQDLKELSRRGIEPLSPEQVTCALEYLWTIGNVQTIVANINWSLFKQLYQRERRLLLEEIDIEPLKTQLLNYSPSAKPTIAKNPEFLQELKFVNEAERYDILRTLIQNEAAKVLGLNDSQVLSLDRGFFEMGMNSLMSFELSNNITQLLGVTLPSTLLFDFPNIEQLTKYIAIQMLLLSSDDIQQINSQREENFENNILNEVGQISEEGIEEFIDHLLLVDD
jgi:acyl transferase domain-containing protein/acyl-CoA synthetase (AMP-forming)/AMP-acid ligase II/acyl carrier protein